MGKNDLVVVPCEIVQDDPDKKAIAITDGTETMYAGRKVLKWYWLPRSQTQINSDGTVTIPEWLAFEKGLI